MASFTERLKVVIDVVSQGATKSLSDFKTEVGQADTFTGKLRNGTKALGSTLSSFVSSPAGAASALAGAATAAVKLADEFSQLAKTAIDVGKATGMTTEQASRWIAVADDAGLSAEEFAASAGRIARSLDSGKWEKYGIATRDAGGNLRSTNDILLDALDLISRTSGETDRARIGTELFGKGWSAIAPIVGSTREEYEALLSTVDSGQVITAGEAVAGEKWRLAMDDLGDALTGVKSALGEVATELAPVIKGVSDLIGLVPAVFDMSNSDLVKEFNGNLEGTDRSAQAVVKSFQDLTKYWFLAQGGGAMTEAEIFRRTFEQLATDSPDAAMAVYQSIETIVAAAYRGDEASIELANSYGLSLAVLSELKAMMPEYAANADRAASSTEDATEVVDENAEAVKRQRDAFDKANRAMAEQLELKRKLYGDQRDAIERQRDYNDAQADLVDVMGDANATTDDQLDAIIKLSEGFGTLTGASLDSEEGTKRQIYQLDQLLKGIDPSSPLYRALADYITQLKNIPANVDTQLRLNVIGAVTTKDGDIIGQRTGARALGGPVDSGSLYQVGEGGKPELLTDAFGRTYLIPGSDGVVTPIGSGARSGGGANVTFNITVSNPMMSGEQLANELRAFISRNGAGWLTR